MTRRWESISDQPRLTTELCTSSFARHCYLVFFCLQQNKPLIEKRRRARINECLSQLQTLVLKAKQVEVSCRLFSGIYMFYLTTHSTHFIYQRMSVSTSNPSAQSQTSGGKLSTVFGYLYVLFNDALNTFYLSTNVCLNSKP